MKFLSKLLWVCTGLLVGILSLHLLSLNGYAAEGSSNWRPIYDLIMRWINFGIIVFVVYKYARKPFMNFLRGRKEKVAEEIEALETRKEEMNSLLPASKEIMKQAANSVKKEKDKQKKASKKTSANE